MKIVNSNGNLMDVEEAASYLGVKKSTIYQMSMKRKLPVVKIGRLNRFRKSDLDAFINSNIVEKDEDPEISHQ